MPLFLHEIFTFSPRSTSMSLIIPKPNINLAKSNFAFQGSSIWNALVKTTMNKCNPNSKGIMIPGSAHFEKHDFTGVKGEGHDTS